MGETYISCQEEKGSINISEDVISSMVRTAVAEVEGVAGLSNTAGAEIAELIGRDERDVSNQLYELKKKLKKHLEGRR